MMHATNRAASLTVIAPIAKRVFKGGILSRISIIAQENGSYIVDIPQDLGSGKYDSVSCKFMESLLKRTRLQKSANKLQPCQL